MCPSCNTRRMVETAAHLSGGTAGYRAPNPGRACTAGAVQAPSALPMGGAERQNLHIAELDALAVHCTRQEDAAQKVERQMRKSEAALLLESRVGERFDALVTGNAADGVWVRLFNPPAEGKVIRGVRAFKVGDKLRVKLLSTNVERGFIDFESV